MLLQQNYHKPLRAPAPASTYTLGRLPMLCSTTCHFVGHLDVGHLDVRIFFRPPRSNPADRPGSQTMPECRFNKSNATSLLPRRALRMEHWCLLFVLIRQWLIRKHQYKNVVTNFCFQNRPPTPTTSTPKNFPRSEPPPPSVRGAAGAWDELQ